MKHSYVLLLSFLSFSLLAQFQHSVEVVAASDSNSICGVFWDDAFQPSTGDQRAGAIRAVASADLDGDGRIEIVYGTDGTDDNPTGRSRLVILDGETGVINYQSNNSFLPDGVQTRDVIIEDYGNDGDLDIIMAMKGGFDNSIVVIDGDSLFIEMTKEFIYFLDGILSLDYIGKVNLSADGQHKWVISDLDHAYVLNELTFEVEWVGPEYISSSTGGRDFEVFDWDDDGKDDFFIAESDLWHINFSDTIIAETVTTGACRNLTIADMDGDGSKELYAVNGNGIFKVNSDQSLDLQGYVDLFTWGLAGEDLDGDGTDELVVMNLFQFELFKSAAQIVRLPVDQQLSSRRLAIADLNGNGQKEIVFGYQDGTIAFSTDCSYCLNNQAAYTMIEPVCSPSGGAIVVDLDINPDATYFVNNNQLEADSLLDLYHGEYDLRIEFTDGCQFDALVNIPNNSLSVTSTQVTDRGCGTIDDGAVRLNVNSGVNNFQVAWSNGMTGTRIDSLGLGQYHYTITDSKQCEIIDSVIVEEKDLNIYFNTYGPSCLEIPNGRRVATFSGAASPVQYYWNGIPGFHYNYDLPAGENVVIAIDATTCSDTMIFQVDTVKLVHAPVILSPDCNGLGTGAGRLEVVEGGSSNTYNWEYAGAMLNAIDNVPAGDYPVEIITNKGCTFYDTLTIPAADLIISTNGLDPSCFDTNNGTAFVTVDIGTSPFMYFWPDENLTTDTITGLGSGSYAVEVTDAVGCHTSDTISLLAPTEIQTTFTSQPDSIGTPDREGSLAVQVASGTPPYRFLWSTGDSTATVENLAFGTYSLTVTDGNDCEKVVTATVEFIRATIVSQISVPFTDLYPENSTTVRQSTMAGGMEVLMSTEELTEKDVAVFPNPTTGLLSLKTSSPLPLNTQLQLYSLTGKQLETTNIGGQSGIKLNISRYPPGTYLLKLHAGKQVYLQRIVLLGHQ